VSDHAFRELSEKASTMVESEHERHPLRVGLPLATLAERLAVDSVVAELVVSKADGLERVGPDVSVSGRVVALGDELETDWDQARSTLAADLAVPTVTELGLNSELLHLKLRSGELTRISQDLVWLPSQIEEVRRILQGLPEEFTVAQFRDAAGLSRKYAVPLLEWADAEGLTVRRGDTRTLR
jgi:selenocysteine-specific elongation factor